MSAEFFSICASLPISHCLHSHRFMCALWSVLYDDVDGDDDDYDDDAEEDGDVHLCNAVYQVSASSSLFLFGLAFLFLRT